MGMYEEDRAHQFILGLNDDLYSTLRSQILALDPLPLLDQIFNMTKQEDYDGSRHPKRNNRGFPSMRATRNGGKSKVARYVVDMDTKRPFATK